MNESTGPDIIRRLDVIINLLLERKVDESPSLKQRIMRLFELGLSPTETASILGKPLNQITAERSRQKGKAKKAPTANQ